MIINSEKPAFEITSRSLSAHDFATAVSDSDLSLMFGVNREMTVKALRLLADRIEKSEVYVQSARVSSLTNHEDFTTSILRLALAEGVKVKKK